jgi:NTP pyrophosphatase (non-canonical NTP hydrolase)
MEFKEYQTTAHKTAQYPQVKVHPNKTGPDYSVEANWIYPVFGLVGETGELAEKLKKVIRNQDGILLGQEAIEIGKEIGDILWYLSEVATALNLDLDNLAQQNLNKLKSREKRDVIKSEGDNR